jgi:hypothetical protein
VWKKENTPFPSDWFTETVTVEELDGRYASRAKSDKERGYHETRAVIGSPGPRWDAFKKQVQPGDRIVMFSSPRDHWANLAGREGIALVRDNTIVAEIITLMN